MIVLLQSQGLSTDIPQSPSKASMQRLLSSPLFSTSFLLKYLKAEVVEHRKNDI